MPKVQNLTRWLSGSRKKNKRGNVGPKHSPLINLNRNGKKGKKPTERWGEASHARTDHAWGKVPNPTKKTQSAEGGGEWGLGTKWMRHLGGVLGAKISATVNSVGGFFSTLWRTHEKNSRWVLK